MPADNLVGAVARMLALKRNATLAKLPAAQIAVLAEHARDRLVPRGTVLLREGEPIESVYYIVDGRAHLTLRGRTLGDAGPGTALGAPSFFARDPEGLGAVAETDVLALELDADTLLEIFEDHFPILLHILREMCRELVEVGKRVPAELAIKLPPSEGPGRPTSELDLVERIFVLRRAAPFTRTSISALAELARGMAEIHFQPGVELWREGEPAGGLLLLVSGRVVCTSQGVSFEVGPGSPLGALESMADRPRLYQAVTHTPVVALQGNVENLIDTFEDNFEMAMDYLAVMARWLLELLDRYASGDLGRLYGIEELPSIEAHREPPASEPEPAAT
jgi:CRP-like cAMP-binding protein